MDTVFGLFGILLWIVGVMGLAAGVTWLVIRLSPGGKSGSKPEEAPNPLS
jgi:hypothetical protein